MAYTVSQAYTRTLQEADKMGSDYFTLPEFLNVFQKEVYDFVENATKDIEETQLITDDIRPLIKTSELALVVSSIDPKDTMAAIPLDYFRRARINVIYTDNVLAREPQIIRHGEADYSNISPYKKATKEYPIITQHSDFFNVKTNIFVGSLIQPSKLLVTYVSKPVINKLEHEIITSLNDSVCELLFGRAANSFMATKGDPRVQMTFQHEESFRNKNNK